MNAPAPNRAGTHLLGFALFGWAWPAFIIAGRILLWIATAVLVVVAFVIESARWIRARFR